DQTGPFTSGWTGTDLTKEGTGTLMLSSTNTSTGITTVNAGTLYLMADSALGATSALNIANNAVVNLNHTTQTVGKLNTLAGSQLLFNGGTLTISDTQRSPGDTVGGTLQANTLAGSGMLIIDPSIVQVYGANPAYTGDITLTGGSELIMNNPEGVGSVGFINMVGTNDKLTFTNLLSISPVGILGKALIGNGTVETRGGADITLTGSNTAFSGLFDIGTATTLRVSSASQLGSATVKADGTFIATALNNWTLPNPVTGTGQFIKTGHAYLLVDTTLAAFNGNTRIQEGALLAGNTPSSTALIPGNVQVDSGGTLSGTGTIAGSINNQGNIAALNTMSGYENSGVSHLTVGPVTNSGQIILAGASVGNTLTIKGGLTSQGGSITIHTSLDGDNSPTDKLILDGGSTAGSANLKIINKNGIGAQTRVGILVVETINGASTTVDAFSLSPASSGYRTDSNSLAIGAYDYNLLRGGNGGNPNSWYLNSTFSGSTEPNIRPEAGSYLANREAAESMFIHSLRDRLDGYQVAHDQITGEKLDSATWARVYGNRRTTYAMGETLRSKTDTRAMQVGMDLFGQSTEDSGTVRAGLMFSIGNTSGDTNLWQRRGVRSSNTVDAYAVGAYATWFQDQHQTKGWYADTWIQHGWFDNEVKGKGLAQEKYDSRAWSASLEAGYSIPLQETDTAKWSFEPSAQIIYTDYIANSHREAGGTLIHQSGGDKLTSRVGGRLRGQYQTESGKIIEPFIEVNWWHSDGADKARMNDDRIRSDMPRNTGEMRAGAKYILDRNLFLSADLSTGFGENQYRTVGGQISVRYAW
ncbi:MAG: autotransporter outer membrane beta-barrel domain-containing protein, partial [Azovibrio sp.]